MSEKEVKECFANALKDEKKGKKHKGLLIVRPDDKKAKEYLSKAKINLELCQLFKQKGFDYKIPEEWFYTFYYCALAISARFGVESRNQRCTAAFIRYLKESGLIEYDDEFIDRITVYTSKEEKSDVDEREGARYGSSVKSADIEAKYNHMNEICKKAISECEEIVFSAKEQKLPKEIRPK
jgi:hypothetical protein